MIIKKLVPPIRALAFTAVYALALGGCIPEEDPIAPYDRGGILETVVPMESDYRYQVYIDVESGTVVGKNLVTSWDLGFRCDPDEHHVVLNGAKIMAAADLGPVDFASVVSADGLEWRYDASSGEWDSTAIGSWWSVEEGESAISKGHVYVIDRGYEPDGDRVGYAKLTLVEANAAGYRIRIASLDNGGDRTLEILKDTTRNLVGLSFDDGGKFVEIEPPNDSWDLLFTRYTHLFRDPTFTPYSVTGILLNRAGVEVAADTLRPFDEITSGDLAGYTFTTRLDAIGYDWKTYDFGQGIFIIHSPVYLLRDTGGFYYKLRLLDFYNDGGEKGYPKLESRKL